MNPERVVSLPSSSLSALLERELDAAAPFPGVSAGVWEEALTGPAREILGRPSKELRAQVVETCYRLAGGRPGALAPELPLAVELLHAGSLIVDDIEDQSATRRGAPALHHLVGLPVALNTGNWMYFWALELLATAAPPSILRAAVATLARCHRGQALDLAVCVCELPQGEVAGVVAATTALKTGSLMELAATLGAAAAGASAGVVGSFSRFGHAFGVGLQMLDDLGGIISARRADKGAEDLRNGRPTWPWAWLAERASELRFTELRHQGRAVLGGADPAPLAARLAESVADHGGAQVHQHLEAALTCLDDAVPSADTGELRAHIDRLEQSYA